MDFQHVILPKNALRLALGTTLTFTVFIKLLGRLPYYALRETEYLISFTVPTKIMKTLAQIQEHWDDIYRRKKTEDIHGGAQTYASLLKTSPSLLDVGCGDLHYHANIPEGMNFVGLDISREALAIAKSKAPNASLVCASANYLPFRDNSFYNVSAIGLIQNIPEIYEEAVEEISRVTKKEALITCQHVEGVSAVFAPKGTLLPVDENNVIYYGKDDIGVALDEKTAGELMARHNLQIKGMVIKSYTGPDARMEKIRGWSQRENVDVKKLSELVQKYRGNFEKLFEMMNINWESKDYLYVYCEKANGR